MLARDELGEQPEREELDPDHDEQHAEEQQRPLPDRLSAELLDREVDEDPGPQRAEQEPGGRTLEEILADLEARP